MIYDYVSYIKENNNELPKNIRLGNTYEDRYLKNKSFISKKIDLTKEESEKYKSKYEISNPENTQIYHGFLYIFKDGSAIMNVNYKSYSNVKNKYKVYFDLNGKEIIHKQNISRYEKEYFEKITKK